MPLRRTKQTGLPNESRQYFPTRNPSERSRLVCAPPYGYRIIQKQIQKDPDTAPIVNEAYAHYFRCYSVRKVYTHLQERYGTAAPSFNKVDRLFKNEKYCGRWHGNLQYCEPYITPEQFEQIRSVKNSRTFSLSGEAYIFSGLIVCPLCGRHYTGSKNSHTLKDGSVSRRKQYRCMPKYSTPSDHRGGTPIVTEKYVENWMLDHVIGQLHEELLRAEKNHAEVKNPDRSLKGLCPDRT